MVGEWIAIGLSAGLLAWFVGGFFRNRQRSEEVLRWLRDGMARFGSADVLERAGRPANAFRLAVEPAAAPFRRAEAIYLLEPRENLPLWIYGHLQGGRDELILRFTLRSAPEGEIEAGPEKDAEFRQRVTAEPKKPFRLSPGAHGFEVAQRGRLDPGTSDRLRVFLEEYGAALKRLSIHRQEPHLLLRARLPELLARPAQPFFTAFAGLIDSRTSLDGSVEEQSVSDPQD